MTRIGARNAGRSLAGTLASCVVLGGCSLATPARWDRVAPHDIGANHAASGMPEMPLTGSYDAIVHTGWTGPIRGRVLAEPTEDGFKANTPPDVAWTIVGGFKGALGSIFAPFLFPRGMILTWTSSVPTHEQPGVGTIGPGTLSSLRLRTRLPAPGQPMEILLKDGRVAAVVSLTRAGEAPPTTTNYASLVQRAKVVVERHLFDDEIAESSALDEYFDELKHGADLSHDDFEFLLSTALAARRELKLAAPLLYPARPGNSPNAFDSTPNRISPHRFRMDEKTAVATLRFDAITSDADVDRAFDEVLAAKPKGLVLDLRQTVGLDVGALRVLAWMGCAPTPIETFLGRDREHAPAEPAPLQIVLDSPEKFEAMRHALADGRPVAPVVPPDPRAFRGPVGVAVGGRTSGVGEALVSAINASGRAPTFGQPTAGKPFVGYEFDIGQGWVVRLNAAKWVRGQEEDAPVRPQTAAPPARAADAALRSVLDRIAAP